MGRQTISQEGGTRFRMLRDQVLDPCKANIFPRDPNVDPLRIESGPSWRACFLVSKSLLISVLTLWTSRAAPKAPNVETLCTLPSFEGCQGGTFSGQETEAV